MPARSAFEYAVIRVVPRVERGEFINVGVVLFCRTRRFLGARLLFHTARLAAFAPDIDLAGVEEQIAGIPLVCVGGATAGPIGLLPQQERFRWLTAPRSTIVQVSPVHCGLCEDPRAELARIATRMILAAEDARVFEGANERN
ncbi:MAG: DUF3037 domain-containing protein [Roseiflexaceae bacterium]